MGALGEVRGGSSSGGWGWGGGWGAPLTARQRLGMFIFTIINTSSYKDKIQSFKLNITDHGHVTRSVAFTAPPYKILPALFGGGGERGGGGGGGGGAQECSY